MLLQRLATSVTELLLFFVWLGIAIRRQ